MKPTTLFCCHCLLFAWYAFVVRSISTLMVSGTIPVIVPYGGQWKFLTVLNLVILYGTSSLADALVLMKKYRIAKSMFPFRDLLFSALAFPFSMFVFISFWAFYSYDRELIYPHNIDVVISPWINHAMHTGIFPLSLLDLLITPRRYPSKGKGLSLLAIGSTAYICWLLWIHSVTGKWAYPLFDALSPFSRAVFFAGSAVILIFMYNVGEFLCRMIWGDSIVILDTYKRKSK